MPHQIVKHEVEHRINLSLFKHRGDVYAASRETGVPVDYVKKIYAKLKKRRERDVSYWLASSIMQTVFEGYQQRTAHLQKYLNVLDGSEQIEVSACHRRHIIVQVNNGVEEEVCSKCKKPCEITYIPRSETFELFGDIITQLREEDKSLVSFADTMGFTEKEPPAPILKQNILVVNDRQGQIDPDVAKEFDTLSPRDREKARKRLESHILNNQPEEPNEK